MALVNIPYILVGMEISRCTWANIKNSEYVKYHDNEWGETVWETVARPFVIDLISISNLSKRYTACVRRTSQLVH